MSLGHFLCSRICQSKTAFFDRSPNRASLRSRKGAFSTQLFSIEFSDWGIQKLSRKGFCTCCMNPSHRSSHHQTHTHTATHPYQVRVPHSSIIHGADADLAITAVASRRKSAWRIPSSVRQQRVSSHDGSSARYRSHFANNGYACWSFGGSRLSATPRT